MKRNQQDQMMSVDKLLYYPTNVPAASSNEVVFTVCKVMMSGDTPRLEHYWQKALTNVVGWRLSKAIVRNPAFVADVNLFYLISSNLPTPSPNEGRVNGSIRQILGSILRPQNPGTLYTVQEFPIDTTSWTRVKNYMEIDNLWLELLAMDGSTLSPFNSTMWAVEIEFLCVVYNM